VPLSRELEEADRRRGMGRAWDRARAVLPLSARRWLGAHLLTPGVVSWLAERGWVADGRPDYLLARRYLGGLHGIEIGASAHNRFSVKALNVDRYLDMNTVYKQAERRVSGRALRVDVAALGDELPFADKSVDFVLASHVIEHFPDPIKALREWDRVARRYVFLVVPHRDRTFDSDRPLTPVDELLERHAAGFRSQEDRHWSVWSCESFLELCQRMGLVVVETEDPDLKVGNGFAVVIRTDPEPG
jgi:SAM-dependent methyltransferase